MKEAVGGTNLDNPKIRSQFSQAVHLQFLPAFKFNKQQQLEEKSKSSMQSTSASLSGHIL